MYTMHYVQIARLLFQMPLCIILLHVSCAAAAVHTVALLCMQLELCIDIISRDNDLSVLCILYKLSKSASVR
jgi:hypothetical protein